jgi:hypothetical protein
MVAIVLICTHIQVSVPQRQRVMFKLQALIQENQVVSPLLEQSQRLLPILVYESSGLISHILSVRSACLLIFGSNGKCSCAQTDIR